MAECPICGDEYEHTWDIGDGETVPLYVHERPHRYTDSACLSLEWLDLEDGESE